MSAKRRGGEAVPGPAVYAIEAAREVAVDKTGASVETDRVFVKVYREMATSGLLREMSGNELKVLIALSLEAKILGQGPEGPEHFRALLEAGVVREEDEGRLFCFVSHQELMEKTGLADRTVTRCTDRLAERGLIEKRLIPRRRDGRYAHNVYFIKASSIGKFKAGGAESLSQNTVAGRRPSQEPVVEITTGESPVVKNTTGSPPVVKNTTGPVVKITPVVNFATQILRPLIEYIITTTTKRGDEDEKGMKRDKDDDRLSEDDLSQIFDLYAYANGRELYPWERDALRALVAEFDEAARRDSSPESESGAQWVMMAIRCALDEGSARKGYVCPKLLRTICQRWARDGFLVDTRKRRKGKARGAPLAEPPPGRTTPASRREARQGGDSAARSTPPLDWEAVLREVGDEDLRRLLAGCQVVALDNGLLTVAAGSLLACNLLYQHSDVLMAATDRHLGHPCALRVMFQHPTGALSEPSRALLELEGLKAADEGLWPEVLRELEGSMTRATFSVWLAATELVGTLGEDTFVIACRNLLDREWLTHRLQGSVDRALSSVTGREARAVFIPRFAGGEA